VLTTTADVDRQSGATGRADHAEPPFPGGVVYVNLRGRKGPLSAHQVLATLEGRLGSPAPASADDADLAACADDPRAHLARRAQVGDRERDQRVLLVLDNVDDPNQVAPLLPLPAQCRVLLAGCPDLSQREDVTAWWLGEPTPAEAAAMFMSASRAPGHQVQQLDPFREPAVRKLIELCGRMPRPVRALGYQMARHRWPPDELLETLRRLVAAPAHQEVRFVDALDLLAEQDVAYTALSPRARRLYRRLSLASGPLEPEAVALLSGPQWLAAVPWPRSLARWARERTASRSSRLVDELATAGFVESPKGGCRIREPFAPYAKLHLRRDELPSSRVRTEVRLTRHLARTAERHASRLATTGSLTHSLSSHRSPDDQDPCAWFELHHRTLRRLVTNAAGAPGIAPKVQPRRLRRWWFRVAVAVCTWYAATDYTRDWDWTCRKVLATPTAGDRWKMTSWAWNELGVIRRRQGDAAQAHDALARALRERGHWGEAQVLTNIGLGQLDRGDDAAVGDALWNLRVAARHRSLRDRAGVATTDLGLGLAHFADGELVTAQKHLWEAVQAFDRLGDRRNAAAARTNLGLVYWQRNEQQEARETLATAVEDYRHLKETTCDRLTDRQGQAAALLNLGAALVATEWSLADARRRRGKTDEARETGESGITSARDLLEASLALRSPDVHTAGLGRTRLYLGDTAALLGESAKARAHWLEAAEICRVAGDSGGATAAACRLELTRFFEALVTLLATSPSREIRRRASQQAPDLGRSDDPDR
jgi:tetratricopeptide (TPR) repeat protein